MKWQRSVLSMMHKQSFSDVIFSRLVLNCWCFFPFEVCKILLFYCSPNYKSTHELAILSACCAEDGLTRFQTKNEFVEYACRRSTCFCLLFLLTVRFLKSVGNFTIILKSVVLQSRHTRHNPHKNKIVKIRLESFWKTKWSWELLNREIYIPLFNSCLLRARE